MSDCIMTLPLRVEPFTEDFMGTLSWGVLGNLLLRISEKHATANEYGYEALIQKNKAWVLSRLSIVMSELPKTYDEFTLSTWVTNSFRQFTTRNYTMRKASGEVLGYATSVWAMIDTQTRAPYNIDQFDVKGTFAERIVADDVPIAPPERIRLRAIEPVASYTTGVSDIDINGHVNSIRYLQLLLNLFPIEKYRQERLVRIDIMYAKEAYCGDELRLFLEHQEGGKYATQIVNVTNEVVVKALFYFE